MNTKPIPPFADDQQAQLEEYESTLARLRELDELKSSFVNLVSHELRTPVTLLNGYLEIGIDDLGKNVSEETRNYFERARTSAARLARIVQELTDFARLQQSGKVGPSNPLSIRETLYQVIVMLKPHIEAKSITPDIQLPRDIQNLKYDDESLIIIFRNLLSNSIKFSPKGGKVWIAGQWTSKRHIEIAINDTADRIPEEKLNLIFQDFRQLENHMTRRYEGLGLGLAVARRTARSLGGDITLQVREDGNTFLVTLPIE